MLTVQPSFLPGTVGGSCYICHLSPRKDQRTGEREPVVDTGISIHMEGGLGICRTCVIEMARLFGMVTSDDVEDLRAELADAKALAGLEGRRADEAETLLAALRHYDETHPVSVEADTEPAPEPTPAPAPRKPRAKASA